MEVEVEKYRARTKKSDALFREARKYTPYGVHSNYRYTDPYPLYIKKGRGSRLWDVDGNEYIDFNMAFGALVAGHSHPALVEAMRERIENGTIYGFEGEDIAKLEKHTCERFKLDLVKFSMTGLDATLFATRVARAYTGRKKILKFEGCYHGSHDMLMVSVKPTRARAGHPRFPNSIPGSQGLLPEAVQNTVVAPFNDLGAVDEIVKLSHHDLAAIILEPVPMNMGFVMPKKGFLQGIRKICDEYNLVLIFDEVKTGGKWYGGIQDVIPVKPDLQTFGKAIGGGYPIAAVGGKKDIMEVVAPGVVGHAGTFNTNPVSVTAALTTMTKILTPEGMRYAQKLGNMLGKGYEDIVTDRKLAARLQYDGISGALMFTTQEVVDWRSFMNVNVAKWYAYWTAMLNRGVVPGATGPDEQWTMSVQHTKDDVERHIELFDEAALIIKATEEEMPMVEAI